MSAKDRMKRLIDALGALIDGEFSGYIKINFSQGSLGRVEKFEEIDGDEVALPKAVRAIEDENTIRRDAVNSEVSTVSK